MRYGGSRSYEHFVTPKGAEEDAEAAERVIPDLCAEVPLDPSGRPSMRSEVVGRTGRWVTIFSLRSLLDTATLT